MHRALVFALTLVVPTAALAAPATDTGEIHIGYNDVVVEVGPDVADIITPGEAYAAGYYLLYVNRCQGGVLITRGFNDSRSNSSSIVPGPTNFAPYPYGESSWSEVMSNVRQILSPFGVEVTDQDPGETPHTEIIACGRSFQGQGVLGVAPFGCGLIANAIGFAFAEDHGDSPRGLAETIAHEAGHTWSLNHLYDCEDPMTYLHGCGQKTFQDRALSCAGVTSNGWAATDCGCGGSTQNSFRTLLDAFGPNNDIAPSLVVHSPRDGAFLAPEFAISADVGVGNGGESVELLIDGVLRLRFDPGTIDITAPADITEGVHEIVIAVEDQFSRRAEERMNVTVSASCACADDEFCDGQACFPKGTVGDECWGDATCETGTCATSGDDSLCTSTCEVGADQCPGGFECFPAGDTGFCWPDGSGGCGCQSSNGAGGTAALLLFALAFIARSSRRRSRSS